MTIRFSHLVVALLMTAITSSDGFGLPSGITGRTLKPGSAPGCAVSSCHKGVAEASVTIKGPAFLRVNEVARCTVLVAGAVTGINISTSAGTLQPVSRLISVNEELTHPCAGTGTYIFDYVAPARAGTQTLYATGLSGGADGPWGFASNKAIYVDLVASAKTEGSPLSFALGQNFPNPFNPATRLRFSIPRRERTTLTIYNLLGQVASVLVDGWMDAGQYTVSWNAGGFPSGVYFYRLESGSAVETKRLILLR